MPTRHLTLFDLDHTLLPIDSDYEWGKFIAHSGFVDQADYQRQNQIFFEQYKAGTLDIVQYHQFGLAPLTTIARAQLEGLQEEFMRTIIQPHVRPQALALVEQHQVRGDLCAIVTATNAFVTAPIAQLFKVEHLIATIPEQQQACFTGRVRGIPCFRAGKVARVEIWLESLGMSWFSFATTTFYSDSHNDLALLEQVTHPVAINADQVLYEIATARGWPTLKLFND